MMVFKVNNETNIFHVLQHIVWCIPILSIGCKVELLNQSQWSKDQSLVCCKLAVESLWFLGESWIANRVQKLRSCNPFKIRFKKELRFFLLFIFNKCKNKKLTDLDHEATHHSRNWMLKYKGNRPPFKTLSNFSGCVFRRIRQEEHHLDRWLLLMNLFTRLVTNIRICRIQELC